VTQTLNLILLAWLILEILTARRHRAQSGAQADRGSFVAVWGTIALAFVTADIAVAVASRRGVFAWPLDVARVGVAILLAGIVLRHYAIRILGQWFTPRVTIQRAQQLVTHGPYRLIRHPTYAGLWLALVGAGLATRNLFAALALAIIPLVGVLYRIRVEERALVGYFGEAYVEYARRTWRLIPFVY
jgi:protein-S-isoprenylcysteine O-methyltransferase